MNITLEVDGVLRRYTLDQTDAENTNWTEEVLDIIDSIEKAKSL
jgi:hypothetical protein